MKSLWAISRDWMHKNAVSNAERNMRTATFGFVHFHWEFYSHLIVIYIVSSGSIITIRFNATFKSSANQTRADCRDSGANPSFKVDSIASHQRFTGDCPRFFGSGRKRNLSPCWLSGCWCSFVGQRNTTEEEEEEEVEKAAWIIHDGFFNWLATLRMNPAWDY